MGKPMAISRKTFLYEVLMRFGPEGLQGVHAIDLEQIVEGKTVHAETALPARPVEPAELAALIGEKATDLIEQVSAALAEADVQRSRADAAEQRLTDITEKAAAPASAVATG